MTVSWEDPWQSCAQIAKGQTDRLYFQSACFLTLKISWGERSGGQSPPSVQGSRIILSVFACFAPQGSVIVNLIKLCGPYRRC